MKLVWLIPLSVVAGFLIDLMVGDPQWMPHPIRFIGHLISAADKKLRREGDEPARQRTGGALLVLVVLGTTVVVTGLVVFLGHRLGSVIAGPAGQSSGGVRRVVGILFPIMIDSVLCAYCLAVKSLKEATMKVCRALERGRVEKARHEISMIVGRDTNVLDEKGMARAAIECVAESTSDGVIAPLFYMIIGGPVLGMAYKAINTMDSMVGYKNDKYRYFGTAAARLDDVVNFIPARLSALALIASAFILKYDGKNAWKIFRRDRYKHASPNSAQTESVCAGALNLRLAGDAVYFGKKVSKPYIGDAIKEVEPDDIRRANRMLYVASALSVVVFTAVRLLICRAVGLI